MALLKGVRIGFGHLLPTVPGQAVRGVLNSLKATMVGTISSIIVPFVASDEKSQ